MFSLKEIKDILGCFGGILNTVDKNKQTKIKTTFKDLSFLPWISFIWYYFLIPEKSLPLTQLVCQVGFVFVWTLEVVPGPSVVEMPSSDSRDSGVCMLYGFHLIILSCMFGMESHHPALLKGPFILRKNFLSRLLGKRACSYYVPCILPANL